MKKLIFILIALVSIAATAQNPANFPNGIRMQTLPTVSSLIDDNQITTITGTDGIVRSITWGELKTTLGAEPALGNPATDGFVLSSTAAGVRSWVAQSGGGGGEPALGNPAIDGQVLASTTTGTRSWVSLPPTITAANGLTLVSNSIVQLGGTIFNNAVTTIGLNSAGILAFTGTSATSENSSSLTSDVVSWSISDNADSDSNSLTLRRNNAVLENISNDGDDTNNVILSDALLQLNSIGASNRIGLELNKSDAVFKNLTNDLFRVAQNGTITAPNFSNTEIDAAGDNSVLTKRYGDANYLTPGTGLQRISEGTSSGFAKVGENRANKGDIGDEAFDLGQSFTASTTLGATGDNSFSIGVETTASSSSTFAGGAQSNATASFSFSYGSANTSSGNSSVTMGQGNNSPTIGEMTVGRYATTYTPVGGETIHNDADRIFTVGNGTTSALRSDALIVTKGGKISAPSYDNAEVTDDQDLIHKGYADATYVTQTVADFTPTLVDAGGGATYAIGSASGQYVKTGRNVFFKIRLENITTTGTPSGELRLSNLPFANSTIRSSCAVSVFTNQTVSFSQILAAVESEATYINFTTQNAIDTGTGNFISSVTFTADFIEVSGTYIEVSI